MIQWIMCFIFGHKFVQKIPTGKIVKYYLGEATDCTAWKWEAQPYCLRCGKQNVNYEER